jgi:hypothetical protein
MHFHGDINVGVSALSMDSPSMQRKVAAEVSKAIGTQGGVPSTTGFYNG